MGGMQGAVEVRQESAARPGAPAPGRSSRRPVPALPAGGPALSAGGGSGPPRAVRPVPGRRPDPGNTRGGRSAATTARARTAAEAPGVRRDPVRPGGRPVPSGPSPARPVRACAPVAPQVPGGMRLTRRGRLLVVVLATALALAGAVLAQSVLGGGPGSDLRLAGGSSVVVQPGDSVWSIAVDLAGGEEDVRAVVDAIQERNGLEGGAPVVPGQVLQVP